MFIDLISRQLFLKPGKMDYLNYFSDEKRTLTLFKNEMNL